MKSVSAASAESTAALADKERKKLYAKTLALQRFAMRYYAGGDYYSSEMDSDYIGNFGDTLALFVWREMGDAEGDIEEALRMMNMAIKEMENVRDALQTVVETGNG